MTNTLPRWLRYMSTLVNNGHYAHCAMLLKWYFNSMGLTPVRKYQTNSNVSNMPLFKCPSYLVCHSFLHYCPSSERPFLCLTEELLLVCFLVPFCWHWNFWFWLHDKTFTTLFLKVLFTRELFSFCPLAFKEKNAFFL